MSPDDLQVNSSPSLGTDSAFDGETKTQLIADTIALVDPVSFDHAALARMLDARLGPSRAAVGSSSPALKAAGRRAAQAPVVPSDAERDSLEDDLAAVLRGRLPRAVGEMPANLGHYDRSECRPDFRIVVCVLDSALSHLFASLPRVIAIFACNELEIRALPGCSTWRSELDTTVASEQPSRRRRSPRFSSPSSESLSGSSPVANGGAGLACAPRRSSICASHGSSL